MYTMASVPQRWCFGVGVVLLVLATCVLGKALSRLAPPAPCSLPCCTPSHDWFPLSLIYTYLNVTQPRHVCALREISF